MCRSSSNSVVCMLINDCSYSKVTSSIVHFPRLIHHLHPTHLTWPWGSGWGDLVGLGVYTSSCPITVLLCKSWNKTQPPPPGPTPPTPFSVTCLQPHRPRKVDGRKTKPDNNKTNIERGSPVAFHFLHVCETWSRVRYYVTWVTPLLCMVLASRSVGGRKVQSGAVRSGLHGSVYI